MNHDIVTREQWLVSRKDLLQQEKAHRHESDRLAQIRRELPWVKIEKDYVFTGEAGPLSLTDLFDGQSQLIIYHLMYGVEWEKPCPGCSAWADAFNGTTDTFAQADATMIAVSRAPYPTLQKEAATRGWSFTWVSSGGSDFNIDYGVSTDEPGDSSVTFGSEKLEFERGENQGISVFVKNDNEEIFHTYSCYNRGIEAMNGAFGYYDILPHGRQW